MQLGTSIYRGVVAILICYHASIGPVVVLCVVLNRKAVVPDVATEEDGATVESFSDLTDHKQDGFK